MLSPAASAHLAAWRGGLALLVLAVHSNQVFWPNRLLLLEIVGTAGVMCFFAMSGFFIQRALERSRASGGLGPFVASRANRILPPMALALLVTILLSFLASSFFASGTACFRYQTSRDCYSLDGLLATATLRTGFSAKPCPPMARCGPFPSKYGSMS